MPGSAFGQIFRIVTFGESHGKGIGVVIDGCPAGLELDISLIEKDLKRRRPGQSVVSSQRQETDTPVFLSGIFEGKTTGAPITIFIENKDHRPADYDRLKDIYRPSHADFTYDVKYGNRDFRGGGRSSARETAARVAAGAVAKQLLKEHDIQIIAFVSAVGPVTLPQSYLKYNLKEAEDNPVRCPDPATAEKMQQYILKLKEEGDTTGGIISCIVTGVAVGLGEPVFDKLHADLGKAMLSINAVKGFEIGSGFKAATMKGSDHNDEFTAADGKIRTRTNNSGGIQGGISNGEDIYFNVAFKPVATLMQKQSTVNQKGEEVEMEAKGRHDACVVPRAVPIVEAMAALILADHILRNKTSKI
ncbi:MAG: chorismate synthase [Bacteroidia bacterium]